MKRKHLMTAWLLIALLSLTSCGLIPKEEEYPSAPLLVEAEVEGYVLTPVVRGDVILTQTIRSSYIPSAQERLSFSLGGEYFGRAYVSAGDQVKAGDLLMELDITDITEAIDTQKEQLDSLYLRRSQLYDQKALAIEEARIQDRQAQENQTPGWTSHESSVTQSYNSQIQSLNNTISVSEARMRELQAERDERQLYASIDGTVTEIYTFEEGERVTKDKIVIQIANMEAALFEIYSSNWNLLTPGETYTLNCNKVDYQVIAMMGADLEVENLNPEKMYLIMVTPDPTISKDSSGNVTIVTDQSLNTLYVQADAVQELQGKTVVYLLDENGYRYQQEVKVGLTNGKIIEILSGLSEGEYVIMP